MADTEGGGGAGPKRRRIQLDPDDEDEQLPPPPPARPDSPEPMEEERRRDDSDVREDYCEGSRSHERLMTHFGGVLSRCALLVQVEEEVIEEEGRVDHDTDRDDAISEDEGEDLMEVSK